MAFTAKPAARSSDLHGLGTGGNEDSIPIRGRGRGRPRGSGRGWSIGRGLDSPQRGRRGRPRGSRSRDVVSVLQEDQRGFVADLLGVFSHGYYFRKRKLVPYSEHYREHELLIATILMESSPQSLTVPEICEKFKARSVLPGSYDSLEKYVENTLEAGSYFKKLPLSVGHELPYWTLSMSPSSPEDGMPAKVIISGEKPPSPGVRNIVIHSGRQKLNDISVNYTRRKCVQHNRIECVDQNSIEHVEQNSIEHVEHNSVEHVEQNSMERAELKGIEWARRIIIRCVGQKGREYVDHSSMPHESIITVAIMKSPLRQLKLYEILMFYGTHFQQFKNNTDGWVNSIVSTLRTSERFVQVPPDTDNCCSWKLKTSPPSLEDAVTAKLIICGEKPPIPEVQNVIIQSEREMLNDISVNSSKGKCVQQNSIECVEQNSIECVEQNSIEHVEENSIEPVEQNSIAHVEQNSIILVEENSMEENSIECAEQNSIERARRNIKKYVKQKSKEYVDHSSLPHESIITVAIMKSPLRQLKLYEILMFYGTHFQEFKNNADAWVSSIVSTLRTSERFVQTPPDADNCCSWKLSPLFVPEVNLENHLQGVRLLLPRVNPAAKSSTKGVVIEGCMRSTDLSPRDDLSVGTAVSGSNTRHPSVSPRDDLSPGTAVSGGNTRHSSLSPRAVVSGGDVRFSNLNPRMMVPGDNVSCPDPRLKAILIPVPSLNQQLRGTERPAQKPGIELNSASGEACDQFSNSPPVEKTDTEYILPHIVDEEDSGSLGSKRLCKQEEDTAWTSHNGTLFQQHTVRLPEAPSSEYAAFVKPEPTEDVYIKQEVKEEEEVEEEVVLEDEIEIEEKKVAVEDGEKERETEMMCAFPEAMNHDPLSEVDPHVREDTSPWQGPHQWDNIVIKEETDLGTEELTPDSDQQGINYEDLVAEESLPDSDELDIKYEELQEGLSQQQNTEVTQRSWCCAVDPTGQSAVAKRQKPDNSGCCLHPINERSIL